MNKYSVFYGIDSESVNLIFEYLNGEKRFFKKGEWILKLDENGTESGIIHNGTAYLISVTDSGEKNIINFYSDNHIFGKKFLPHNNVNLYYIIAKTDCHVTLFPYQKIFSFCHNLPNLHTKFLHNILTSSIQREQIHIDILSQRTIRQKLLVSFRHFSEIYHTNNITLPMPLLDFADYLGVDRSAMMRELKKLNNENFLISKGKHITLLNEHESKTEQK